MVRYDGRYVDDFWEFCLWYFRFRVGFFRCLGFIDSINVGIVSISLLFGLVEL